MNTHRSGPAGAGRSGRGNRGFTLIEMVVVVTLSMVVIGTVAPRLKASPSLQVHRLARLIATQLEMARTHALSERVAVEIDFDETPRTYTAYADYDRDGTISRTYAEIFAIQGFGERELDELISYGRGSASMLPGDPSASAITLPGSAFTLNTRGLPEPWGTMGTVYLVHRDDANAVAAVSVSASGSFKAWRWSAGEGEWQ